MKTIYIQAQLAQFKFSAFTILDIFQSMYQYWKLTEFTRILSSLPIAPKLCYHQYMYKFF